MEPLLEKLVASPRFLVSERSRVPNEPGVYLLSESDNDLYIGRAKSLRGRMQGHGSRSHYSASFALKLARKKTNRLTNYKPENGAKTLMTEPAFQAVFYAMVDRVKAMQVRHIVEPDDHVQYLFEMYASLALDVPYCDFATH
jgi:hypothetical protein